MDKVPSWGVGEAAYFSSTSWRIMANHGSGAVVNSLRMIFAGVSNFGGVGSNVGD